MSLLSSYSYGICNGADKIPAEILKAFTFMTENPEKRVEYACEIIEAAMRGSLRIGPRFSVELFELGIKKRVRLNKYRDSKKLLSILPDSDDFPSGKKMQGIQERYIAEEAANIIEDAYEDFINDEELKWAVQAIKDIQPMLLIEDQMDIIITLRQALIGIPDSIRTLKRVCEKYEVVAEQIQAILSSGYTFAELFG